MSINTRTITQRLADLELNEDKLGVGKDVKKQELLNEWVAFADAERQKGNPTFWETFKKWGTASDKERLASFRAMGKFNPTWLKEMREL